MIVCFTYLTTSGTSGAIWTLPLEAQIAEVGAFIPPFIIIFLMQKSKNLTFEKRIFLKLHDAYKCLSRYNSLSGSSSQEQEDFEKSFAILKDVSLELKERKGKSKLTDMGTEINSLFGKIGDFIQTRILPSLKEK